MTLRQSIWGIILSILGFVVGIIPLLFAEEVVFRIVGGIFCIVGLIVGLLWFSYEKIKKQIAKGLKKIRIYFARKLDIDDVKDLYKEKLIQQLQQLKKNDRATPKGYFI